MYVPASEHSYLPDGEIVLAPHSATWGLAFEREASAIVDAIADLTVELHHVGSTAIPGIVAKPVIDMLGIVPAVENMDLRAHCLAMLGYEALGEFGIPGRRYFRKNASDGARTHQLHVFAAGSPEIRRHLDFRDYLRAFPAEAAAYAALKQDLAQRCCNDMHAYSDGKTKFITAVERRAAEWRQQIPLVQSSDLTPLLSETLDRCRSYLESLNTRRVTPSPGAVAALATLDVPLQAHSIDSCDAIGEIGSRARAAGAWVHFDGAFGLWARVAPSRAHLVEGIEHADSWATDAHKWLNVPYDSGIAFVRNRDALRKSMAVTAEYLPTNTPLRNPSDYTPELSRRGRGVDIWAAMRSLGREGLAEMVERNCSQARRFADAFRTAGLAVLNDVVLNQTLVQFGDAERTKRVIAAIQDDGTMWAGETVWQGKTAMRISVSSWATTDADVERCIAAVLRISDSVT